MSQIIRNNDFTDTQIGQPGILDVKLKEEAEFLFDERAYSI
jgi:hypothetical protein